MGSGWQPGSGLSIMLLLLLAMLDALVGSAVTEDVTRWVATAPAWQDYSGETDSSNRLVHQFTICNGNKFTLRCDPITGRYIFRGKLAAGPATYLDDVATCQALADALCLPPEAIRVNTLETGVTLSTSEAPTAFLAKLARSTYGSQQAPFYATEPPRKAAHPLQYVAHSNEMRVKVYDRGTFARLRNRPNVGNCLRFELHYLKSRRIGAALGWNGSVTLANIMQPDVYRALAQKLLDSWNAIHLPAPMNTLALDVDDLFLFVQGQDPAFWEAAKPYTPAKTYQRRRARFRELQKQVAQADAAHPYSEQVRQLIAALQKPQI